MKVSFEITSCVNMPSQSIPGIYLHKATDVIDIVQTELTEWRSRHKVLIHYSVHPSTEEATDIGEEIRTRLVAMFSIVSRVDASATDELLLESSENKMTVSRRGDGRELKKLATACLWKSIDPRLASCTDLEWNALKRLRHAMMSNSFSDKFNALVGTVDILGRNDYPELKRNVSARMNAYLTQRLAVPSDVASRLITARHNNVHENVVDSTMKADFNLLLHPVADDLCVRLRLPIKINGVSRVMTDDFALHYAPATPHASLHKAGRNDPCPCGSMKKYKKCCGAPH